MHDEPLPNVVSMPEAEPERLNIEASEDALALEYATRYKDIMRYEGYRSRWFKWGGSRWEIDHKLVAYSLSRSLVREISGKIQDAAIKNDLADLPVTAIARDKATARRKAKSRARTIIRPMRSAKTIHAIVSLARSDVKLSADFRQWDADEWLLNTPEGTIDLRDGSMRSHRVRDYITKSCTVSPEYAPPTLWLQFLDEVTQGSADMISYLQRMLGYCLTGTTKDHALFYAWGRGQNGKTTILETVGFILGDYWIESPPQAFIATNESRHETEIARMHNVRLVTSDELPQGKEWDTSKVKRLTGGSTVSARFMRQDYFEFEPQFKLLMAGNDKPSLRYVDDAIRRRFHLIPFTHRVPDHKKDRDLGHKLQDEAPRILSWMIEGCLAWQSSGLQPAQSVRDATDDYLAGEDSMTSWFEECCGKDQGCFESTTDLFQSWASWARANEEYVGSRKNFSQQLSARAPLYGLTKQKTRTSNGFGGLELLKSVKSPSP